MARVCDSDKAKGGFANAVADHGSTVCDHEYYLQLKGRLGANGAALTIARKLLRRAHDTLRDLGDAAIAPAA